MNQELATMTEKKRRRIQPVPGERWKSPPEGAARTTIAPPIAAPVAPQPGQGMKIGYARVSSVGQSLEIQLEQLVEAGCQKIFSEKQSGRSTAERDELAGALAMMRAGDVLVVTKLDRLARSVPDLFKILEQIDEAGASFQCLQQSVDTTTSTGKLTLAILGAVAEFENEIRRERQLEGIAKAKERGTYKTPSGARAKRLDRGKVKDLLIAGELGASDIARACGIGRASVYRIEKELRAAGELDQVPA